MQDYEYLLSNLDKLKGVGKKTKDQFNKKNINNIFDLLWHLPISKIETSEVKNMGDLQIGKKQSIRIIPKKYNFPRIRNLPNKVICEANNISLDCIFFNSYEGYIKKILPINKEIIISGKVNYFRNKYQIVNPSTENKIIDNIIDQKNKYSLTEGLNLNKYNKIIKNVLSELPDIQEWLDNDILKKFNNVSWKESIIKLHESDLSKIKQTNYYKRLVFDEIFADYLLSSKVRLKIKKHKKKRKKI